MVARSALVVARSALVVARSALAVARAGRTGWVKAGRDKPVPYDRACAGRAGRLKAGPDKPVPYDRFHPRNSLIQRPRVGTEVLDAGGDFVEFAEHNADVTSRRRCDARRSR